MGGVAFTVSIRRDSPTMTIGNVSAMPIFWFKDKSGWVLVVSRVGGEDFDVFERVGFLSADAGFWKVFSRYYEVCAEACSAGGDAFGVVHGMGMKCREA